MSERYTYGDTDLAAERLGLVARVFEPTTRAFLERSVTSAPSLAYDLGCGPGHTTRLVRAVTGAARVVGLDRSGPFLDRAVVDAPWGVSFDAHDVREVPFPDGPADLIYCRLLLAHLVDPPGVVERWTTQLASGGQVLLDELEAIDAADPVFARYLGDVALPVVEAQGAQLLAGPVLAAMVDPPGTERVADDVVSFTPPPAESARIFGMNLAVLVERGEISPHPDLAADLAAIADDSREAEPVVWRMRQLTFRRTAVSETVAND